MCVNFSCKKKSTKPILSCVNKSLIIGKWSFVKDKLVFEHALRNAIGKEIDLLTTELRRVN